MIAPSAIGTRQRRPPRCTQAPANRPPRPLGLPPRPARWLRDGNLIAAPVGSRAALAARLLAMVASASRQPPVRLDFLPPHAAADIISDLGRQTARSEVRFAGSDGYWCHDFDGSQEGELSVAPIKVIGSATTIALYKESNR